MEPNKNNGSAEELRSPFQVRAMQAFAFEKRSGDLEAVIRQIPELSELMNGEEIVWQNRNFDTEKTPVTDLPQLKQRAVEGLREALATVERIRDEKMPSFPGLPSVGYIKVLLEQAQQSNVATAESMPSSSVTNAIASIDKWINPQWTSEHPSYQRALAATGNSPETVRQSAQEIIAQIRVYQDFLRVMEALGRQVAAKQQPQLEPIFNQLMEILAECVSADGNDRRENLRAILKDVNSEKGFEIPSSIVTLVHDLDLVFRKNGGRENGGRLEQSRVSSMVSWARTKAQEEYKILSEADKDALRNPQQKAAEVAPEQADTTVSPIRQRTLRNLFGLLK